MQQEKRADYNKCYAPGKRISIQPASNNILFRIWCESGAHQLRRAAGIDSGKEPGAKNAQNEEMYALREHCHLKETCEDGKVDDRFGSLTVVGCAQSGNER